MSAPPRACPARGAESGFVLPAVLAIMIVVSAAALVATERHRTRLAVAESQTRSLRLQGLADGAARLVATGFVLERTRGVAGLGLPRNGASVACDLAGGRRLTLAVQDHAGLIDLNAAPRPLLETAFRALGLGDSDALTLAAEVLDYRDANDDPEPNGGAEAPQYAARALAYGPRNGPFTSVDEIERLPSLTADRAARLRNAVTVYNPGGGIDPALAPERALVASVAGDGLRPYTARSSGQYVEVRASVADDHGRATRSAMVSAGGTGTGTLVLSWQPDGPEMAPGAPHPACAALAAALIRP
ncbi:general secretion pathway protein GspK [Methylobacterium sp. Leaf118]|uniref:general secretion pathway protein GspK n=1 Tax=Methylobacterium sp. Leaf118 TaxID=2876562 RepID=UPI001E3E5583|nr:type II secretion system protein GspK [Methylobacterium sp. Leaf118]